MLTAMMPYGARDWNPCFAGCPSCARRRRAERAAAKKRARRAARAEIEAALNVEVAAFVVRHAAPTMPRADA
jgi:hypothetical protein